MRNSWSGSRPCLHQAHPCAVRREKHRLTRTRASCKTRNGWNCIRPEDSHDLHSAPRTKPRLPPAPPDIVLGDSHRQPRDRRRWAREGSAPPATGRCRGCSSFGRNAIELSELVPARPGIAAAIEKLVDRCQCLGQAARLRPSAMPACRPFSHALPPGDRQDADGVC